jgi:Fe-S cluster assembly iron-binding protein IscA
MTTLLIDNPAIELMRNELIKENAFAMRIFIGGGGCCKRFEIIPVKKALAGDITFMKGGVRILVEKEIVENTSGIRIKYDEHKGLLIDLT